MKPQSKSASRGAHSVQVPPHCEQAERSVLASVLLDPERRMADLLSEGITDDVFYLPDCRILWSILVEMYEKCLPIDALSIRAYNPAKEKIKLIGGDHYIESLIDDTPTDLQYNYFKTEIIRLWRLRQLICAAETLKNRAYSPTESPISLASDTSLVLSKISSTNANKRVLGAVAREVIDRWASPPEHSPRALRFPYRFVDRACGPLESELVYIAGQASAGKTAIAVNIATAWAKQGFHVAIASLESSAESIAKRFIAHIGQVNTLTLRNGYAPKELYDRAYKAADTLKDLPITVCDTPMTDTQLRAWSKQMVTSGSNVILIDNIKHVQPSFKYNSEVERFKTVSEQIKWMRDEIRIPVIVLHHLSDEGKMAWSRDITRDADVIITIEKIADTASPYTSNLKAKIVKNRDGLDSLEADLVFHKDVQTIKEAENDV